MIVTSTQRRVTPIKIVLGPDCNMIDRLLIDSKLTELTIQRFSGKLHSKCNVQLSSREKLSNQISLVMWSARDSSG